MEEKEACLHLLSLQTISPSATPMVDPNHSNQRSLTFPQDLHVFSSVKDKMATHHHTQYVHYTPPGTHTSPPTSITPSLLNGNPTTSTAPSSSAAPVVTTVAPQDTTYIHPHRPRTTVQPQPQQTPQPQPPAPAPPQQPAAQPESPSPVAGSSQGPLIATGDWTKDLVHLAKTAELK